MPRQKWNSTTGNIFLIAVFLSVSFFGMIGIGLISYLLAFGSIGIAVAGVLYLAVFVTELVVLILLLRNGVWKKK